MLLNFFKLVCDFGTVFKLENENNRLLITISDIENECSKEILV